MTEWTIKKNHVWHIYADGKQVGVCDNEEAAIELLKSVMKSKEKNELP
jgi:hypothetical protein